MGNPSKSESKFIIELKQLLADTIKKVATVMIKILTTACKIHEVPYPELKMDVAGNGLTVEFDDTEEVRWSAHFWPHQAFRETTIDCINTKPFYVKNRLEKYILEDMDSLWIKQLTETLKEKDSTANFMSKAHHYAIPYNDGIIEIVAWKIELLKMVDGINTMVFDSNPEQTKNNPEYFFD